MTPYYQDDSCAIFHADCREAESLSADVLLTDPPFGINYVSGSPRRDGNARSIEGDIGTIARDSLLRRWNAQAPALIFGSPRAPEPPGPIRARLIWDQDGALGMGDLSLPWKPSWCFIFVLGGPWAGSRDCGSVLRCPPVQSVGRRHPNEKPVALLGALLDKCIEGTVLDPFMGSGSTLVAAKSRGRKAIGIEIEERYCEIAAKRLGQEVLDFGVPA